MYHNFSFVAIIPARGGSKGIPNKNIIEVCEKPLIQYTIESAKQSKYLDDIIVSTDSEQIANIARNLGASIPFLRPSWLATDESKTIDTVIFTLDKLNEFGEFYDYVVLLQPTQPLRKSLHIDEAIEKIIKYKLESLVSVSKVKEHPILMRTIREDETLKKILNINSTIRRQDFPDVYKVNGAIYINKINKSLNKNTSLNDNKLSYIMDEKYDLDIDSMTDLNILKKILCHNFTFKS